MGRRRTCLGSGSRRGGCHAVPPPQLARSGGPLRATRTTRSLSAADDEQLLERLGDRPRRLGALDERRDVTGAQGDLLPALQIDDELALQGVDRLVRGERIRETLRLRAPQPDYQGRALRPLGADPVDLTDGFPAHHERLEILRGDHGAGVLGGLGSHHHSFFCRYESEILSRQMVSDSVLTISRFRQDELYPVAQIENTCKQGWSCPQEPLQAS